MAAQGELKEGDHIVMEGLPLQYGKVLSTEMVEGTEWALVQWDDDKRPDAKVPSSLCYQYGEDYQASTEIYRDPVTGLPMHRHSIAAASDDGYDFDMPSPS
jgi:hypothetical protein